MSRASLTRTGSPAYQGYLRSQQWGFRRVRWFRDRRAEGFEPACQVCDRTLTDLGSLDLHHTSYEGVGWDEDTQKWWAEEADEELMPMCRDHHGRLHDRLDRRGDFYGWSRHRASIVIAAQMRREYFTHHPVTPRDDEDNARNDEQRGGAADE
ncbi:hypothetical protein [Nesterenkonia marinintestina]|uniref:hypothetical protein n=1 Tax=Nesterenkonia marinintestina TaxID=2979865 RepID=UPI0021C06232|nr:hypothetical protein [Nesterenkonia sp. GX14115]